MQGGKQKPIINTSKLSVIYNKGKVNEFQALYDIDLEIYPNEYVAIFGPSGCGKSTLLNVISGLESPAQGKVRVFGKDITRMPSHELAEFHRSNVGMIFQAYNLISTLNVVDNVMLPQVFEKVPHKDRRKKAEKFLKEVGLGAYIDNRIQELSGGQQQRVGIARSLINNPPIILADEPVGNLDSHSATNVMKILDDLNKKQRKTIILVTHEPQYLKYADRIIYMKDGRIVREAINEERMIPIERAKLEHAGEEETIIKSLAKSYPYLNTGQLRVKALSASFAIVYSEEERQRFEKIISKFINKKISKNKLYHLLDLPYREGGMGLYKQTAEKISEEINDIIHVSNYFYHHINKAKKDKDVMDDIVRVIYKYLKEFYGGHFTTKSSQALKEVIKKRILRHINKDQFNDLLNTGIKEGGVGLNERSARNLTRSLETVLVKYQ